VIAVVLVAGAVIAAFPLWLMSRALRAGVWNGRGVDVFRNERPTAFWFGIATYAVIAAIIFGGAAYLAWKSNSG
jgi:hypothetical protein